MRTLAAAKVIEIHVATFPWQAQLVWILTLHDNSSASHDVQVDFSAHKRGDIPAGEGSSRASVGPERDAQVRFTTTNLGYGDYFYDVTVVDADGEPLGQEHGMFEMCTC